MRRIFNVNISHAVNSTELWESWSKNKLSCIKMNKCIIYINFKVKDIIDNLIIVRYKGEQFAASIQ